MPSHHSQRHRRRIRRIYLARSMKLCQIRCAFAHNLALGERRANAVRDYMVASGVPGYRIETISYGEENPVAYGSGESSWSKNRRVEIK